MKIEINELEFALLCKTLQAAIDKAGKQPAPKVMALCDLLIKIKGQRDRRKP